jgi:hypothetical protein
MIETLNSLNAVSTYWTMTAIQKLRFVRATDGFDPLLGGDRHKSSIVFDIKNKSDQLKSKA